MSKSEPIKKNYKFYLKRYLNAYDFYYQPHFEKFFKILNEKKG